MKGFNQQHKEYKNKKIRSLRSEIKDLKTNDPLNANFLSILANAFL